MSYYMFCFFFFKQKTAYEMRISDWSSDVCSSDLRLLEQDATALKGFDVTKLSAQAQLSHRMYTRSTDLALRDFKWRNHRYVMTQMGGMHTRVPSTLTNSHPIASRSEEHTSELQSLMRISYAVFCLKKKKTNTTQQNSKTRQQPKVD